MNKGSFPKLCVAIVVPAKRLVCLGGLLWTQRYGPLQVASVVRDAGYFVQLFNEELGLRVSAQELAQKFDVVGFSCKTSAISRAEKLAEAIKGEAGKLGRHVVTVLGGEHISIGGDTRFSPCFDYMLRGESEEAFLLLLRALESDEAGAAESFPGSLEKHHSCESFTNIPDLSLVVGYDQTVRGFSFKWLFPLWILKKGMLPILTFQRTRGCPYNCSFCPTPRYLQGNKYRHRNIESSLKYLRDHIARSGIRRVMFEDPTAALPFDQEAYRFFEALAKSSIPLKATVLVRADICEDRRLLEVMRAAGVTNLSVGIESLNDQTRGDFKKKTSYTTIRKAVDIFHEGGFTITGLFIVGYDTDNLDTFQETRDFIRETGIEKWRASPLSQMPEMPDQLMPAHRFFLWDEFRPFGRDLGDYANGEFVIFYPKHMKPSTLQRRITEFNLEVTTFRDLLSLFRQGRDFRSVLQRLGNNYGQRKVLKEIAASKYFEMVQEVEGEFYSECNGNESLQEDLLLRRYQERVRRPLARRDAVYGGAEASVHLASHEKWPKARRNEKALREY
jgi:radical SAM superfamily enzyme YgiQ (UPF0313 family)